jgi:cell wall-associated NlpC family hydrolase
MRAIGDPLTAEESAALVEACRSLVGRVRFRHQGRNPAIGLDCAGMVGWGLWQIGRSFFDLKGYGREPHKNGLRQAMETNFGPCVPKASMQAGDVPLMRFAGDPRHVGIVTTLPDGRTGLIHVHSEMKYVAEHGLDGYWGDIVAVFRP